MSNISAVQKRPECLSLVDALHALAEGNDSVRLPVAGSSEQRQLAQAFNALAERGACLRPASSGNDEDESDLARRSEQLLAQSQCLVQELRSQQLELGRLTERIVQQLAEGPHPQLRARSRSPVPAIGLDQGVALFTQRDDEHQHRRPPGQSLILTLAGRPDRQEAMSACGFASLAASDAIGLLNLARQCLPDAIVIGPAGASTAAIASLLSLNPRTQYIPLFAEWLSAQHSVSLEIRSWLAAFPSQVHLWHQQDERCARRVLILDPDPAQRRMLAECWLAAEAEPVPAASVEDALALLCQGAADAMMVGAELDGIDPFEWLAQVAQTPGAVPLAGLPLLLCASAEAARQARLQINTAGGEDELPRFLQRLVRRSAAAKQPRAEPEPASERRVLLVDGDMRNRYLLADQLQTAGIQVLIADGGKDGLEMLLAHSDTHLVLMDVSAPLGEGEETIRIVRSLEEFRHLPIIALGAEAERHRPLLDAGASDCLPQPLNAEHLSALLQVWLA